MDVTLGKADSKAIGVLAGDFAAAQIDSAGHDDHAWLHAPAPVVAERINQSVAHRLSRGGLAFVLFSDDQPVGFLTVAISEHTGETFTAVPRRWQRQGVGTAGRRAVLAVLSSANLLMAQSLSRAGSGSSRISELLGYQRAGITSRPHPRTGDLVDLELWQLKLQ